MYKYNVTVKFSMSDTDSDTCNDYDHNDAVLMVSIYLRTKLMNSTVD